MPFWQFFRQRRDGRALLVSCCPQDIFLDGKKNIFALGSYELLACTVPLGDWLEKKKSNGYNHKTTVWVSHEYYLNSEFQKI